MVANDDWMKAAMMEDTMVAQLLVRLKQAHALAPIKSAAVAAVDLPPPRWGVRQPRSRLTFRCDAASPAKGVDSRRFSPTTPLSWSAGTTSSSGTADGFDDSDLPGCGSSRSKGIATNDDDDHSSSPASAATLKSRKKKSFEEQLNEEELVSVNNEINLIKKRMKLDMGVDMADNDRLMSYNKSSQYPSAGARGLIPRVLVNKQQTTAAAFVVPDLNLMPNGEEEPSDPRPWKSWSYIH